MYANRESNREKDTRNAVSLTRLIACLIVQVTSNRSPIGYIIRARYTNEFISHSLHANWTWIVQTVTAGQRPREVQKKFGHRADFPSKL